MRNADVAALWMYCKMTIDIDGLPNMQKLGRKMLDDHAVTRKCVCVCSRVHATSPLDACILYALSHKVHVWSVLLHHLSTTDCMNSMCMVVIP